MNNDVTLTDRLRNQTKQMHIQAHDLPFFKALLKDRLPIESYVGQLRMLATIHESLEREAGASENPALRLVFDGCQPKLPLLIKDLQYFEHLNIKEIAPAVCLAQSVAENIKQIQAEKPESLIGYLYTLEGSTMGGKVIKPRIARTFNLNGPEGLFFLDVYGEDVKSNWRRFLDRMERAAAEDVQEDIVRASHELFNDLIDIYKILYPAKA